MARACVPLRKARATGRTRKNPKRFSGRKEPNGLGPLGEPPKCLGKPHEREARRTLSDDLRWFNPEPPDASGNGKWAGCAANRRRRRLRKL